MKVKGCEVHSNDTVVRIKSGYYVCVKCNTVIDKVFTARERAKAQELFDGEN